MIPFDPFAWFYSLVGFIQELWKRLTKSTVRRIQETALYQKTVGFLLNISFVPEKKGSSLLQTAEKITESGRIASAIQFLLHSSFVQPFYWLVGLLGLSFEWLVTRQWPRILVLAIPTFLMVILAGSVWYGSRMDRRTSAIHYFELGLKELDRLEAQKPGLPDVSPVSSTSSSESAHENGANNEPESGHYEYVEMLFNRSLLLQPVSRWRFTLGATMLDRGAFEVGRKLLRRIAPDSGRGMVQAHAAVATSYLNEFNRTGNQSLMAPFMHHAKIAIAQRETPKEVFIALAGAYQQSGSSEESLRVLQTAAERYSGISLVAFQQALNSGNNEMALRLKPRVIQEMEAALSKDPANAKLRVRLVQMLDTDKQGLIRSEEIVREGLQIQLDPLLTRTLSEVYRIAFVRQLLESNQTQVDLALLDAAMQADPSNPLVTDQIFSLVNSSKRPLEELSEYLFEILASGNATGSTHAILSEIRLRQGNPEAAIGHLQQVVQMMPNAAKFADQLAQIYISQDKVDAAIQVSVEALSILDRNGQLKERYVDNLLLTVGHLFIQVGRFVDAESALENALKINPNLEEARVELIKHYRTMGKDQEASEHEKFLATMADKSAPPQP